MQHFIRFYSPLLILIAIQLGCVGYLMTVEQPHCDPLLGIDTQRLPLQVFCFLMPGTVLLGTGYISYISYLALNSGRFPPAGIPGFSNRTVRQGMRAKVLSIAGLCTPILGVAVMALGITAYDAVVDSEGFQAAVAEAERQCQ